MIYFDRGKFPRARDEFNYIIMTDPGSKIANESQYYLAEALFQMGEYNEASISIKSVAGGYLYQKKDSSWCL